MLQLKSLLVVAALALLAAAAPENNGQASSSLPRCRDGRCPLDMVCDDGGHCLNVIEKRTVVDQDGTARCQECDCHTPGCQEVCCCSPVQCDRSPEGSVFLLPPPTKGFGKRIGSQSARYYNDRIGYEHRDANVKREAATLDDIYEELLHTNVLLERLISANGGRRSKLRGTPLARLFDEQDMDDDFEVQHSLSHLRYQHVNSKRVGFCCCDTEGLRGCCGSGFSDCRDCGLGGWKCH